MRYVILTVLLIIIASCATNAQTIHTYAGNGSGGYNGDGIAATAAKLGGPEGLAFDKKGNLYIADYGGKRIRKVSTAGIITTVAGTGTGPYNGDNIPATDANIGLPGGVTIDNEGNIYICDGVNCRVRKVDTFGIITTFAGTGTGGYSGDGGPASAAQLNNPYRLFIDSAGNKYITDCGNSCIRKIDVGGIITTVAGNGTMGFSGDNGPATAAQLKFPRSVAIDRSGNLYIADANNHRVRRVAPSGIITTIAGTGIAGYNGDNIAATAAQLNVPYSIMTDESSTVYVVDGDNNRIRIILNGIISTIAGSGYSLYNGDGLPATQTNLAGPSGLVMHTDGRLFLSDSYNYRIRYMRVTLEVDNFMNEGGKVNVYPNPFSEHATLIYDNPNKDHFTLIIYNALGQVMQKIGSDAGRIDVERKDLCTGFYHYQLCNKNGIAGSGELIIR